MKKLILLIVPFVLLACGDRPSESTQDKIFDITCYSNDGVVISKATDVKNLRITQPYISHYDANGKRVIHIAGCVIEEKNQKIY